MLPTRKHDPLMEGEIAKKNHSGNRFNNRNFKTVARNGVIDYWIQN